MNIHHDELLGPWVQPYKDDELLSNVVMIDLLTGKCWVVSFLNASVSTVTATRLRLRRSADCRIRDFWNETVAEAKRQGSPLIFES